MQNFIKILLLFLLIFSCSKSKEYDVSKLIMEKCYNQSECRIDLTEITPFNWDRLVLINEGAELSEVNQTLGFNYENYQEFTRTMLFIDNNKIVHEEVEYYNPSERTNNSVWFEIADTRTHVMNYSSSEADFLVVKERVDNNNYFTLKAVTVAP